MSGELIFLQSQGSPSCWQRVKYAQAEHSSAVWSGAAVARWVQSYFFFKTYHQDLNLKLVGFRICGFPRIHPQTWFEEWVLV